MYRLMLLLALATALAALPATAVAQASDGADEITMEVLDDRAAGEEDFVERIELPEAAADTARENAAPGLDTANEARERGREFGQERAEQARETGEAAREARDNVPDDVGPPDGVPTP